MTQMFGDGRRVRMSPFVGIRMDLFVACRAIDLKALLRGALESVWCR